MANSTGQKPEKLKTGKLVLLKFDKVKRSMNEKFQDAPFFWKCYSIVVVISFIITLIYIPYLLFRHCFILSNLSPLLVCWVSLLIFGLIVRKTGVEKTVAGLCYDVAKCCILCFLLAALIFIPPVRDHVSGLYQKYIEFSKTPEISEEHKWNYAILDENTRKQIMNKLDSTMFQEKTVALNNVFTGLDQIKKGLIFVHQNAEYLNKKEIDKIDETVGLLEAIKTDMNDFLIGMSDFSINYDDLMGKYQEQIDLISDQKTLIKDQTGSISDLKEKVKQMEGNIEENAGKRHDIIFNENEALRQNLVVANETIKTLREEYNYSKDLKTAKLHIGNSGNENDHNSEYKRLVDDYIPYLKEKYKSAIQFIYVSERRQVNLPGDLDKYCIDVVVQ